VLEIASRITLSKIDNFPFTEVVDEFHRVGKHFVPEELLSALNDARSRLKEWGQADADGILLGNFLDTALDKWDGRYDYQTYLALGLLPMPDVRTDNDVDGAFLARDRLVLQLISDVLRFEFEVADGRTDLFPMMRPDERTVGKRYRLGLRAAEPSLRRLGLGADLSSPDPAVAARALCVAVTDDMTEREQRVLRLSNLPVYVAHDEYMFLRILQSFEATFALIAVRVSAAIDALDRGHAAYAIAQLDASEQALHEAALLFSLLATMQVESFRTFRLYTEGASAIQSRNYKMVESLCRLPEKPRLDSPAYESVPEVRELVLTGQSTMDSAVRVAHDVGRIGAAESASLDHAMQNFAGTLLQWRQTHYRLAVRMLGDRSGTGYTEGTPYLGAIRAIPVFETDAAGPTDAAAPTDASGPTDAARGSS
jgi:tryptophan 2,3-dioxygenase